MLIILDPGHGGKDPGAVGKTAKEKDINLSIARVVKGQLVAFGHTVLMTRNEDVFLTPRERTAIANKTEAAMFVSIHCNGAISPLARGIETLYNPDNPQSFAIGYAVQTALSERVSQYKMVNRGIKARKDVWVVNQTRMPSILVECGFVSNEGDESLLLSPDYRRAVGEAIAGGIIRHIKSRG